jgi:hypothetical protein
MGRALLFAACLFIGCAGQTAAHVVDKTIAVGGDVLTCAAQDASTVEHAITLGGNAQIGDWLSVIVGLFHCIPQVVRDIQAQQGLALIDDPILFMLASADEESGGELAAPPPVKALSKNARRRLAAAKVLGQVLNRSVKP